MSLEVHVRPTVGRLLRLLWLIDGRRQRLGPVPRCGDCHERRVLALSWVAGRVVCARCRTGKATELHHLRGRARDPRLVAPVPTNWHAVISALTPPQEEPPCPHSFRALAMATG